VLFQKQRSKFGETHRSAANLAAGVALEQAEMWMFGRRTGHESLLSDFRRSNLPWLYSGWADVLDRNASTPIAHF
jgi:hypothetical protein